MPRFAYRKNGIQTICNILNYSPYHFIFSNSIFLFNIKDNGDRCFMAQKGNEFKEIRLPAKAVDGLLMMNEKKRSQKFDVAFLKALLIGFCTLKKIKENGIIDEEIGRVVKGRDHSF